MKTKECAYCHQDIKDEYYMFMDNFLQLKYFEEKDGSDNIFCSEHCAAQALMIESFYIEEEEVNYEDEDDDEEQGEEGELNG
jgi:hypothetical protein